MKGGPKGAFLKILKIVNGTTNQLVINVRRWDPLKTVPGTGFEKHETSMKIDGKMTGSLWSEAIKKYLICFFRSFTQMMNKSDAKKY